jgi:O-acetylhomoserine (thiol)-lyase
MSKPKTHRFDTLSLHAGSAPDAATGARATPIYQTASFVFPDSDHAAALFTWNARATCSRISNPTVAVLEERAAALEGVSAPSVPPAARRRASCYRNAAGRWLAHCRVPVAVRWLAQSARLHAAALRHRDDFRRSARHRCVARGGAAEHAPVLRRDAGQSGLDVLDIPRVSQVAHEHGVPLLVDSTFTTPWLMRPFDHGADLVLHSATKFLSGHGVVIGGVLVDSGRFDWDAGAARGKFPTLTEPYHGFHDMVFSEESTTAAFLLRARREGIRDFGACMSPFTAFQILQGIETLPVRMQRHVENTRKVVAFLDAHPLVEDVGYPELPGHPDHVLAKTLLPRGCGAVFSFNLRGTRAQGRKFIETLSLFSHLANVGDAKSL